MNAQKLQQAADLLKVEHDALTHIVHQFFHGHFSGVSWDTTDNRDKYYQLVDMLTEITGLWQNVKYLVAVANGSVNYTRR